jgi:hypothetical protein
MARTAAERQAEFKAKRGRQISVPLSQTAWSRLEAISRAWGVSQRQVLERLLTEWQPEEVTGQRPSQTTTDAGNAAQPETYRGEVVRPVETPPGTVTGEVLLLRRHIADLERAHALERDENRRLEASVTAALKRAIAAERTLAEKDASGKTITSAMRR